MHFNDGYERKKFIKEHEKMRKEYRQAGMSDAQIDEIFLYDWDRYKEQRNYCIHTRYIEEYEEFESISTEEAFYLRAENWHQAIENVNLYSAIMSLNDEQRLIIWLYAFEGLTQQEIGEFFGVSRSAIQKRINAIRKRIKIFQKR